MKEATNAAVWSDDRSSPDAGPKLAQQPYGWLLPSAFAIPGWNFSLRIAHLPFYFWLIEATRPGRFDAEGANALGVPSGPERGVLQRGEQVTLADGRTISPEQVLGPPRPGRKLVITGDTGPADEIVEAAWGADVLVTEATFSDEERDRAEETKHQTATQAADLARRANVGMLALTHLSSRYFGPEIAREARDIFPETVVPRDFDVIEVPFAERGTPQLVKGGAAHPQKEQEAVSSAPQ